MKERALQELESRGWFEEQCCQHQDIFRDSMDTVLSRIDADNFPQDLKESLFVEVLGLFRTFIDEFRKWKCTAEYSS